MKKILVLGVVIVATLAMIAACSHSKKKAVATKQIDPVQGVKMKSVADLPVFETTVEEVEKNGKEAMKNASEILDSIAALPLDKLTFDNTIRALDDAFFVIESIMARYDLLTNTSMVKSVREKTDKMTVKLSQWSVDAQAREDVYKVIKAFFDTKPNLVGEDLKLLNDTMTDYKKVGFHLPYAEQKKVKRIKKELSDLSSKISKNITNSGSKAIRLTAKELAGTPEETLQQLKKNKDGSYEFQVGVQYQIKALMQSVPNEQVRKKVLIAYNSRATKENRSLMTKVVQKKAELASILGYNSWADYNIETKMAKSGNTALQFVSKLSDDIAPKFKEELEELRLLKAEETANENAILYPWDKDYYVNKLEKTQYDLDLESLKKYFEMEKTLDGMFTVFSTIFNLEIKYVDAPYVWAPKVKLVEVSDKTTKDVLGYLYLDLYPRPSDGKYGHFAMFTIRSGKYLFDKGYYLRPVVAIVGNFPEPTSERPSLLPYRDVETMFHEFGHALHGILTWSKYASFAGTNVQRDFVEVPSQVFEAWLKDKRVLDLFAVNYQDSSDKFPAEMLEKIKKSELATIGIMYRRQFAFGLMDLKIHMLKKGEKIDIVKTTNDVLAEIYMPYPKGTSFITSFNHLFGGYDAGYYGYAWADNLAADFASEFEKSRHGFLDKTIGMRLRHAVLEAGASKDANEVVRDFLQREPNSDAFLKKLGIK